MNDIDKLQEEVRQLKQRLASVEAAPKNATVRVTYVDRGGFEKVEYKHPSDVRNYVEMAVACNPHSSYRRDSICHDGMGVHYYRRVFRLVHRGETTATYEETT